MQEKDQFLATIFIFALGLRPTLLGYTTGLYFLLAQNGILSPN